MLFKKIKQQECVCVILCVCLWYLAGTFRAGVPWVRDRFSTDENCTVIETACKTKTGLFYHFVIIGIMNKHSLKLTILNYKCR